jgi:methionyl-tRNA synthetase
MSKSTGNVVSPMAMIEQYGVDAFRYFLMAEMSLGQDASFSEHAFITRYNSDLANDLGNLLSRVIKMTLRFCGGVIPCPSVTTENETELFAEIDAAVSGMEKALTEMRIEQGLAQVISAVRAGNRYFDKTAPWTLAKNGEMARLNSVMYYTAEALFKLSVLLDPVMPEKMIQLRTTLGLSREKAQACRIADLKKTENLICGMNVNDIDALFMRIKVDEVEAKTAENTQTAAPAVPAPVPAAADGLINIDDFFKTKLRTAKVLQAERVEGADKLLKLQIQIGTETRQLIAGIALQYSPEQITGKTVVVVANLKPAKIRGVESQGMLLAAKDGKELKIITVDGDIPSGSPVG